MPDKKPVMVELFKQPMLVLSILCALAVLKSCMGLEFPGPVKKVGLEGIEFLAEENRATFESLASLEAKINESVVRIEALESASDRPDGEVESRAFEAAQTVSDTTAEVARIRESRALDGAKTRGYIWIGNYRDAWNPAKLGHSDTGQPISIPPALLEPGAEYRVLGNMVLREGLPANNEQYFRGQASLGVVPRGSRISIQRQPVGVNRESATQYWVEVELLRDLSGE